MKITNSLYGHLTNTQTWYVAADVVMADPRPINHTSKITYLPTRLVAKWTRTRRGNDEWSDWILTGRTAYGSKLRKDGTPVNGGEYTDTYPDAEFDEWFDSTRPVDRPIPFIADIPF